MARLNPYAPEFFPTRLHYKLPQPFFFLRSSSLQTQTAHQPSHVPLPHHALQKQAGLVLNKKAIKQERATRTYTTWRIKPQRVHHCNRKQLNNNPHVTTTTRYSNSKDRQQYNEFKAFLKKKPGFPVVPILVDGDQTSVMIRNIPIKYTRDMLVDFLDEHCKKENEREKEANNENGDEEETILAFDLVYLPIDFRTGMNKGYAFVNFTDARAALKFLLSASNRKWDLFQSNKIREVVAARLQGKEKLERHFEAMNFPCQSEEVLPVCFSPPRDGVIKGEPRTIGKLVVKASRILKDQRTIAKE